MSKDIERRKNPRVMVRALVDYESQDTFIYDHSRDLSEGGVFIQTDKPLQIGEELKLKFSLPDIEKVFEIKGEVIWASSKDSDDNMKGMGIGFKDIQDEDKRLIQEYIERVGKKD